MMAIIGSGDRDKGREYLVHVLLVYCLLYSDSIHTLYNAIYGHTDPHTVL